MLTIQNSKMFLLINIHLYESFLTYSVLLHLPILLLLTRSPPNLVPQRRSTPNPHDVTFTLTPHSLSFSLRISLSLDTKLSALTSLTTRTSLAQPTYYSLDRNPSCSDTRPVPPSRRKFGAHAHVRFDTKRTDTQRTHTCIYAEHET